MLSHRQRQDLKQGAELRNRNPFNVPLTRQEGSRACALFYGCKLWNQLDDSFRKASSVKEFAELYKEYLSDCVVSENSDGGRRKFYDLRLVHHVVSC
jgi:hypothetical protein